MLVEWIMALIVAYAPTWAPRTCSEGDERCADANAKKAGQLEELATAIITSSEREGLDPLMVTSIISRESSFLPEPCGRRLSLENVISHEPVSEGSAKEVLKWSCPNRRTGPVCELNVWDVSERDGYLYYSTCSANEVGFMQLLPGSQWSRSGVVIPGTEYVAVAMSDGTETQFTIPEGLTQDTIAVFVGVPDENDEYPRLSRSRFTVEGTTLTLTNPPAVGDRVVVYEAVSSSHNERRTQLLEPRVNVALGCAELRDHYEGNDGVNHTWWYWIGAYNTGTRHGATAHRYATRVMHRYNDFCLYTVPQPDGTTTTLQEVWEGCGDVRDELEENPEEYAWE
jgi:hypothetical protein